ncbi:MAG: TIGR03668 family PPOX class F420-dependent oxidoreductase [Acetobacteraceae bacterium]|nr:TIGR03668 family PPOX class F420-dependent oxidoreductase [Acetobacteraceae bacterium]
MTVIGARERAFLASRQVAHLATADSAGAPHVVPICFVLLEDTLYVTIDAKPKGNPRGLKRLRNLAANPRAAVVADYYDEDWSRLGWVMVHGQAEILERGEEYDAAQAALRGRYRQYAAMPIATLPVIALRIARVTSWGNLTLGEPG